MATSAPSNPASSRGPSLTERGASFHDSVRVARWRTAGATKVQGAVEVGEAELRGPTAIGGPLRAGSLFARGRLEVRGAVEITGVGRVVGELRAGASVRAGELDLLGALSARGPVSAERRLSIDGPVRVPELAAPVLRVAGVAEISGVVRAGAADLRLASGSRLSAAEGRVVRIAGPATNLVQKVLGRRAEVTVDRIEGERVEVAAAEVTILRAKEVVLGAEARVGTLEGTVVERHPTSHVGPESRSPPPHGLWR